MIWLTRLDGSQLMVNDDHILYVEVQGDTVVTLSDRTAVRVQESAEELAMRVAHWRRRVLGLALVSADEVEEDVE